MQRFSTLISRFKKQPDHTNGFMFFILNNVRFSQVSNNFAGLKISRSGGPQNVIFKTGLHAFKSQELNLWENRTA